MTNCCQIVGNFYDYELADQLDNLGDQLDNLGDQLDNLGDQLA